VFENPERTVIGRVPTPRSCPIVAMSGAHHGPNSFSPGGNNRGDSQHMIGSFTAISLIWALMMAIM
jgi:hypothetical protein